MMFSDRMGHERASMQDAFLWYTRENLYDFQMAGSMRWPQRMIYMYDHTTRNNCIFRMTKATASIIIRS